MTRNAHRTTLIRLFQQLAAMQSALRNQCIVVLPTEPSRRMQSPCNAAHSLELTSTVTNALFVDCKCLCKELVGYFFESSLICDLACCEEEAKDKFSYGGGGRGGSAAAECGGGRGGGAACI